MLPATGDAMASSVWQAALLLTSASFEDMAAKRAIDRIETAAFRASISPLRPKLSMESVPWALDFKKS